MPKKRLRSTWLSHKNCPLYCIDFSGYGADLAGVQREITACEQVLAGQAANSLLVTLDLSLTDFFPEITQFIAAHAARTDDPIRKMAVLGVPGWKRTWYRLTRRVTWPKTARFFEAYEPAKDWLAVESFNGCIPAPAR